MKTLTTPTVPRKARTSERSLHGPQLTILLTLKGSGTWPSRVQMCPTTVISHAHNNNFLPENVPPTILHSLDDAVEVLKMLPDEATNATVLQNCFKGAVGGLVSCCGTTNGDVVDVGDCVLRNLWLKDVRHVVVEDGDSVSPTHREFGETEGTVWHLESGVVTGCFSDSTLIVSNIQVEHSSAGMTCELLGDLFGEGSDAGVLDCDGVERFETVDGMNGVGFFLCYTEPVRVVRGV